MRFSVAVIICLAILFAMDAYFSNGQYFGALQQMLSRIAHHFQR